jgi:hypothetical protein
MFILDRLPISKLVYIQGEIKFCGVIEISYFIFELLWWKKNITLSNKHIFFL